MSDAIQVYHDQARALQFLDQTWDEERVDGEHCDLVTSYTGEGRELFARISPCLNGECSTATDVIGEVLEVTDYVVHRVALPNPDKSGTVNAIRTVLVTADNRRIAVVSRGVLQALARVVAFAGPGPWNPPMKLVICQRRTRSGFNVLTLVSGE